MLGDGYDSMDERRRQLLEAMRGGGKTLLGGRKRALPLFGGYGRRSGSMADAPPAALPALTFNPWLAQLSRGVSNLASPTQHGDPLPAGVGGGPAGVGGGPVSLNPPTPPTGHSVIPAAPQSQGGFRWLGDTKAGGTQAGPQPMDFYGAAQSQLAGVNGNFLQNYLKLQQIQRQGGF